MTNPCEDATTAFSTKTIATIRQLDFPRIHSLPKQTLSVGARHAERSTL